MSGKKGCFEKYKLKKMGDCVNNRTCQTLTMGEKNHKHSELKITDTVVMKLKWFCLYPLIRTKQTVTNSNLKLATWETILVQEVCGVGLGMCACVFVYAFVQPMQMRRIADWCMTGPWEAFSYRIRMNEHIWLAAGWEQQFWLAATVELFCQLHFDGKHAGLWHKRMEFLTVV